MPKRRRNEGLRKINRGGEGRGKKEEIKVGGDRRCRGRDDTDDDEMDEGVEGIRPGDKQREEEIYNGRREKDEEYYGQRL